MKAIAWARTRRPAGANRVELPGTVAIRCANFRAPRGKSTRRGLWTVIALLGALNLGSCRPALNPVDAAPTVVVPDPTLAGPGRAATFRHVFIIVMENHGYDQIVGNPSAPYINQLRDRFASADQYYAIRHPSLPNYLALFSGSSQGMTYDCANCTFDAPNLVDQLDAHGKSWRGYLEGMPTPCYRGVATGWILTQKIGGAYVRRHDPFMNFADISRNPSRCANVVPFTQFQTDLQANRLPDFVWITPNLIHDMHNGTIADGDTWLAGLVPEILASSAWRDDGVLFIVWDEASDTDQTGCCGDAMGGRVVMLVVGVNARRGYHSTISYTHYSLLRTIEEVWGLGYLAHANDPETRSMEDFFH